MVDPSGRTGRSLETEKIMGNASYEWKKSSFSEDRGECVEVARCDGGVLVRDSKNSAGPALWFTSLEWVAFLYGVMAGEFGLK